MRNTQRRSWSDAQKATALGLIAHRGCSLQHIAALSGETLAEVRRTVTARLAEQRVVVSPFPAGTFDDRLAVALARRAAPLRTA